MPPLAFLGVPGGGGGEGFKGGGFGGGGGGSVKWHSPSSAQIIVTSYNKAVAPPATQPQTQTANQPPPPPYPSPDTTTTTTPTTTTSDTSASTNSIAPTTTTATTASSAITTSAISTNFSSSPISQWPISPTTEIMPPTHPNTSTPSSTSSNNNNKPIALSVGLGIGSFFFIGLIIYAISYIAAHNRLRSIKPPTSSPTFASYWSSMIPSFTTASSSFRSRFSFLSRNGSTSSSTKALPPSMQPVEYKWMETSPPLIRNSMLPPVLIDAIAEEKDNEENGNITKQTTYETPQAPLPPPPPPHTAVITAKPIHPRLPIQTFSKISLVGRNSTHRAYSQILQGEFTPSLASTPSGPSSPKSTTTPAGNIRNSSGLAILSRSQRAYSKLMEDEFTPSVASSTSQSQSQISNGTF